MLQILPCHVLRLRVERGDVRIPSIGPLRLDRSPYQIVDARDRLSSTSMRYQNGKAFRAVVKGYELRSWLVVENDLLLASGRASSGTSSRFQKRTSSFGVMSMVATSALCHDTSNLDRAFAAFTRDGVRHAAPGTIKNEFSRFQCELWMRLVAHDLDQLSPAPLRVSAEQA